MHHRQPAVAPEAVLAFDHDGKIQALVENFRKGTCRIQRQRAQHRLHFALEIRRQPLGLRLGPSVRRHEDHAVLREFGQEHVIEQLILLVDDPHGAPADCGEYFGHGEPVRGRLHRAGIEEFFQPGDPYFEEFIQVGARNT